MSLSTEAGMQFLRRNHLVDVGLDVDYTPVVDAWNAVVNEKNRIKSIANLRIKSTLSRPQLRVLASAVCQLKMIDLPAGMLFPIRIS